MCMLMALLLFIVGLAFLGHKALEYRSAAQIQLAVQAKALAEAGMEDVRIKLQRDLDFPPDVAESTTGYRENLVVAGQVVGSYTITLDGTYRAAPYLIYRVTSLGEVGSTSQRSVCRRMMKAEIDVSQLVRTAPANTNPDYRQLVNFQDLGNL